MSKLTKKEVAKASSKIKTAKRTKGFISTLFGVISGYLTLNQLGLATNEVIRLKNVITDNSIWIFLAGLAGVWLLSQWFEYRTHKDHEEGRYTPSGALDVEYH